MSGRQVCGHQAEVDMATQETEGLPGITLRDITRSLG